MQDPQIVQAIEGIKQLVKREFPLNKKRAGEDPSLPPEFRSYDFVNVYELGQTIVEVEIAMKALIDLIKPARADNAEQEKMLRGIKSALEQEHAAWESIKLQKQRKLEEENKAAVGYLRRMHEQKDAAIRSELHAIATAQLETCAETAAEIVQARADLLKTNRLMTNLELLQTIATR